jgi:CHAT domain-containing protein
MEMKSRAALANLRQFFGSPSAQQHVYLARTKRSLDNKWFDRSRRSHAQTQPQISEAEDVQALAQFFTATMLGMGAIARTNPNPVTIPLQSAPNLANGEKITSRSIPFASPFYWAGFICQGKG